MIIQFSKTTFFSTLRYYKFILLILILAFVSFLIYGYTASTEKGIEEYKIYTSQNIGWKSKRVNQFVGDINYTATELPLHYYITKNTAANSSKIDSIYNANKEERVIEIEFQHVDQKDLLLEDFTSREYKKAVEYLAFTIERDFTIVTSSNEIIKCSGVQFERNFKVAPFKRVLLYFNNINPEDTFQLIYQDQLFGNGTIKFNFNETPLKL